jgi:uncharacterized CHY-type Zn-finger protein
MLHCAHFHSRVNKSVRFDSENCDALCFECHDYFDHHPIHYRDWKVARLGQERFDALASRAREVVKIDRSRVLAWLRRKHAA